MRAGPPRAMRARPRKLTAPRAPLCVGETSRPIPARGPCTRGLRGGGALCNARSGQDTLEDREYRWVKVPAASPSRAAQCMLLHPDYGSWHNTRAATSPRCGTPVLLHYYPALQFSNAFGNYFLTRNGDVRLGDFGISLPSKKWDPPLRYYTVT